MAANRLTADLLDGAELFSFSAAVPDREPPVDDVMLYDRYLPVD
jgi:hypothetical protein